MKGNHILCQEGDENDKNVVIYDIQPYWNINKQ
jgi:hypothetical protein